MKIVAFGDSITAGQHVDETQRWTSLITGHELINKGVPGDTTRLALERFPKDVQESSADLVLIQFGHNDANCWATDKGLPRVSLDAFEANLIEMADRAWAFDIEVAVLTITPTLRGVDYNASLVLYNAAIVERTGWGRTDWWDELIDVREVFERDAVNLEGCLLEDGLHLSAEGHRLYADVVQHYLDVITLHPDPAAQWRIAP